MRIDLKVTFFVSTIWLSCASDAPKEVAVQMQPLDSVLPIEKKKEDFHFIDTSVSSLSEKDLTAEGGSMHSDIEYIENVKEKAPYGNTTTHDSTIFKPIEAAYNFEKQIPSTAYLNDLILSSTQIERLLKPTHVKSITSIPIEILMQMMLVDKLMAIDASAALDSICYLTNLRGLDLRAYKIERLPACISELHNLEVLVLDDNQLTKFPEQILKLKKLRYLSINQNRISVLPDSIGEMGSLEHLNLSYNHIVNIPKGFAKLTNLTYLDLRKNIGLNESDLQHCCGLPKLNSLVVSYTGITKLPDCISSLTSLSSLNIEHNNIRSIPSSIGHLDSLETISIANEGMDYNQVFKVLSHCDNLIRLVLIGGGIDSVPNSIGLLKNLQSLNLFDCGLVYLPDEIAELENLRFLNLSNNALGDLNNALFGLKQLETLSLIDNNISYISNEISRLKGLRVLNIRGNGISTDNIEEIKKVLPKCAITN